MGLLPFGRKSLAADLAAYAGATLRGALGRRTRVAIDVTNRCTNNCAHCYHARSATRGELREPTLKEWAARFARYHAEGVVSIILVGGEPALVPEVLLLAHRTFPHVSTISNGMIRLPTEFARRIHLSLDGAEEVTDALRGRGTFATVARNYRGDKRAILNCVLTGRNHRVVVDLFRVADELDVGGVGFNLYTPQRGERGDLVLTPRQRAEIREQMHAAKDAHGPRFYMTRTMIDWLCDGRHAAACTFRDATRHLDLWERPRLCYSDGFDCDQCGCYSGAAACSRRNYLEEPGLFKRLFFG